MPDAPDLTARLLAVQRLLRVEDDGAHVARLADGSHPPEVSRRAVDFVAGVTRQKRWLDFVLAGSRASTPSCCRCSGSARTTS